MHCILQSFPVSKIQADENDLQVPLRLNVSCCPSNKYRSTSKCNQVIASSTIISKPTDIVIINPVEFKSTMKRKVYLNKGEMAPSYDIKHTKIRNKFKHTLQEKDHRRI